MSHTQSSPRHQPDPILLHLYHQGLQLGLPRDQAARILNIGQIQRASSAYGVAAISSPATGPSPYRPSAPSYGSSPYSVQSTNVEYPQIAGLQVSEHYDPYANPQQCPPAASQIISGGTTYYPDATHTHPPQPTHQYENGVQIDPVYGRGCSYNYDYDHPTALNPIQETTEPGHRYSHESYLPETYAGEPFPRDSYGRAQAHGHDNQNH